MLAKYFKITLILITLYAKRLTKKFNTDCKQNANLAAILDFQNGREVI